MPKKPVTKKVVAARRKAAEVKVTKSRRSKDTVSRTVRGAVQMGVAETILRVVEAFGPQLSTDQHVALLGLLTLIVTAAQNVLENAEWMPRLLKPRI